MLAESQKFTTKTRRKQNEKTGSAFFFVTSWWIFALGLKSEKLHHEGTKYTKYTKKSARRENQFAFLRVFVSSWWIFCS